MSLTVSTHYAIPSLIGRGLTDTQARKALNKARIFGSDSVVINGTRVLPVTYSNGKYTIGDKS